MAFLTAGLLRRAVELDNQCADPNLGLVDTSVMAIDESTYMKHGGAA